MAKFTMKTNVAMLAHRARELGYVGQDHTKRILLQYINDHSDDATVSPLDGIPTGSVDEVPDTAESVLGDVVLPTTDDGKPTEEESIMESEGGISSIHTAPTQPTEDDLPAPSVFPRSSKSILDGVEKSFPTITEFVQDVVDMVEKRDNNMAEVSWAKLYDVALRVMRDCRAHDEISVNATIAVQTSAHARRFSTVVRRVIATEFLTLEERQLRHDLWDCTIRLMRTKDYTYFARMFQELDGKVKVEN